MVDAPDIASLAAAVSDASRASMLLALMDGRALTATELATEAGVAPSTASSHLARLQRAGMVALTRQGRHRYFRIASAETAALLEGLMQVAAPTRRLRTGPAEAALRYARVCYDHLAGECGVRLLVRLRERGLIGGDGDTFLTPEGEAWAASLGIDVPGLRKRRRPLCRPCLDWSERRAHLAGALGASLLERLFALRYVRRDPVGRVLSFSPRGAAFLDLLDETRR
jgi:DNA-binding transcriptional ArsR family regulator